MQYLEEIEKILLNVLAEGGKNEVKADQSFNISDDFIKEISNLDGKIIINNFQNQSISINSRKKIVKVIELIQNQQKLIQHHQLEKKEKLLPVPIQQNTVDLYSMIHDEIEMIGGLENFKDKVIMEMLKIFNGNQSETSRFLQISYRTIRYKIQKLNNNEENNCHYYEENEDDFDFCPVTKHGESEISIHCGKCKYNFYK